MRRNKREKSLTFKDVLKNIGRAIKNNYPIFLIAVVCAFFMYIVLSM